ncbi:MAG: MerR family DNA-binding transcriptional regulator [Betaproteobacteria bacterium]|nr:MerR family DNA-binding transcriptional regulator [Betaproteobacteria bacterium]
MAASQQPGNPRRSRAMAANPYSNSRSKTPADEAPGAERAEFSIGDLAREFDVTPRAIRFYEDQGLLAPARAGQRRIYTARDRTRLKLTLRGKRLGLALSEIRELIEMYEPGRDERPQLERFLAVLAQHKASLEQQSQDIEAQLSEIASFEKRCRRLLAEQAGAAPRRPKPRG